MAAEEIPAEQILVLPPRDLVPLCVRFNPDRKEVIQKFLVPHILNTPYPGLCIIQTGSFERVFSGEVVWSEEVFPYYLEKHFWYFISREASRVGSIVAKRSVGQYGRWISTSKLENIKDKNIVIGHIQRFALKNGKLKTGWVQDEYSRYSESFEKTVVSHLFFDPAVQEFGPPLDQTFPAPPSLHLALPPLHQAPPPLHLALPPLHQAPPPPEQAAHGDEFLDLDETFGFVLGESFDVGLLYNEGDDAPAP